MVTQSLLLGVLLLVPNTASTAPSGEDGNADWLELDREIASLHTLPDDGGENGVAIHGRLRTSYVSGDEFFGGGVDDVSGVTLREARIELEGGVGDYGFLVSTSSTGGSFSLTDAYVTKDLSSTIYGTFGRFKQPFLYTGRVLTKYLLFFDRTITGAQSSGRDLGAMLTGDFQAFHWILALQNGEDGALSDSLYLAHGRFDVLGHPFDMYEGSYDAMAGLNLGVGVSWAADDGLDNGMKTGVEAELSTGPFYVLVDAIAYDEEYDDPVAPADPDLVLGTSLADTNPYSVTVAYLLGDQQYELAMRFESFDDTSDTNRLSFGLNWYTELGHLAKWQLDYSELSSDSSALEGNRVELGLALAW